MLSSRAEWVVREKGSQRFLGKGVNGHKLQEGKFCKENHHHGDASKELEKVAREAAASSPLEIFST